MSFKLITFLSLSFGYIIYSLVIYTTATGSRNSEVPLSEKVIRGKSLWQEKNCVSCHQLYGLGGYLGPDLTNEYGRRDTGVIHFFLRNGSVTMPDFDLSEYEIESLSEFLKYTSGTGKYPNGEIEFNAYGSFDLKTNAK